MNFSPETDTKIIGHQGSGRALADVFQIGIHRWQYLSLSLHGLEGALSGSGAKTVIPRREVSKFSIRLMPNMILEVIS